MIRILLTPAALLPVAAAALLACSGIPLKQREAADLARFESYAGAPVDHFTYLGHYDGWKRCRLISRSSGPRRGRPT